MKNKLKRFAALILALVMALSLLQVEVLAAESEMVTEAEPISTDVIKTDTPIETLAIVASGNCGANGSNVTWTLSNNGVLTISGKGRMRDWDVENWEEYDRPPWYSRDEQIKTIKIQSGVTSIGDGAFDDCEFLTKISIPGTLTRIGAYAFDFCWSLKQIDLPNSITYIGTSAFGGCFGLKSITIPSKITTIRPETFGGCSSLRRIIIPNKVTSIGSTAFAECENLRKIYFKGNSPQIHKYAFDSVKATVYYPKGNNSWTKSKKQNYSGKLTWLKWDPSNGKIYPNTPKLSSVSNVKGKKATIKWSKANGSSGYQVQYSTNSKFKNSVKTVKVSGNKNTSKTISKLSKNKKYYVRVRSYITSGKKNYYSGWSNVKNLTIKK